MDRREFLKHTAALAMGLAFPTVLLGEQKAEAGRYVIPTWEPPIYKYFFQFTEYVERKSTERIVIHHTGFAEDKDSTAADIHKYHQEVNGWAGIGYHYLIRKNGRIEQGRQPEMVGAHALHHNGNSVGISLAGNFEIGKPTAEQMASVKELVLWLCLKYRLNPVKEGVIVGHRDLNDTSCPGKDLYRRLGEIRSFCRDNM